MIADCQLINLERTNCCGPPGGSGPQFFVQLFLV